MFELLHRFLDEPESQDLIKAAAGLSRVKPADDFYKSMGGIQHFEGGVAGSRQVACVWHA